MLKEEFILAHGLRGYSHHGRLAAVVAVFVLADRKMRLNDLAAQVGISNVNLSYLKTGKVKAVRFSTLDAICKVLKCQPGDILEYVEDED